MKNIIAIIFFLFSVPLSADPGFEEATQQLNKGLYSKAIENLKQSIQNNEHLVEKYYNLGHAYFRLKDYGRSLYYFRKSAELAPRDTDVGFNLKYVRDQTKDKIEWPEYTTFEKSIPFSASELSFFFLVFSLFFWGLNMFKKKLNKGFFPYLRNLALVGILLTVTPLGLRVWVQKNFAVVVSPVEQVYSGLGKDNVVLFELAQGAEVSLEDTNQPEWIKIGLPDGKKGWIRRAGLIF